MSELERKDKVAVLLAMALRLNAEFDSLSKERNVISEQIYALQSEYKKEAE